MKHSKILQQIIKPEYLKYFDDWLQNANEKEGRGLQLLGAIYKHKGRKKFRAKPPSEQLKSLHQQEEFDIKKAEEMYRTNQITTTYGQEFGYLQKDMKPQKNIFHFKKCSEFIDNWIELNDDLEFQELALACLRSLYSRVSAQQVPTTVYKFFKKIIMIGMSIGNCASRQEQIKQELNQSQLASFQINLINRAYKTNYNAIFKQRLKQEQLNDKFKDLENKIGKEKIEQIISKTFKI